MNKDAEEIMLEAIKEMIDDTARDFKEEPLTQEELVGLITQLYASASDKETDEKLAQFYISCIEYLKTKILIQ